MAYAEHQADRIRQRLQGKGLTEEKKMMGGLIFMMHEKMCVGLDIDKSSGADRLMVRVGKLAYEDLLAKYGARKMDFTGKVMRGFLFIGADAFDKEDDLDFWMERALEFNAQL